MLPLTSHKPRVTTTKTTTPREAKYHHELTGDLRMASCMRKVVSLNMLCTILAQLASPSAYDVAVFTVRGLFLVAIFFFP